MGATLIARIAALALGAAFLLAGCQTAPPELVHVFDAAPREVERNDTLIVRGSGYPPGEPGLLQFEGELFRAGTEPERAFSFEAEFSAETDERAVLVVDSRMIAAFTETEEGPRHATFRGTARVSFAPNLEGAPPIQGSGQVVLDVYPASDAAAIDEELEQFYGAEFDLGHSGVQLASLLPDGRLGRAGLEAGDQIVSFCGLSTLRPSDLEPHAGQRGCELQVVPTEAGAPGAPFPAWIDTEGYRPLPARSFRWGLALLVPIALWLGLSQLHWMHTLLWLLGLWRRGKDREGADARRPEPERLPLGFVPFLITSAGFAAIELEPVPALRDLDLLFLFASVALLELATAFLRGGRRERGFSLGRGLLGLFGHVPLQLCLAFTFLAVVVERASLGLSSAHETLSWQGGPWASPTSFLSCLVLATLALGRSTRATPQLLAQSSSLLLLGSVVFLFFGGTRAPSWLEAGASSGLVWFELKFTLAYLVWLIGQRGLGRLRVSLPRATVGRMLLPASGLALVLGPVWLADVWPDWLRDSTRAGLLGLIAAVAVATATLVLTADRSNDGLGTTNPWL